MHGPALSPNTKRKKKYVVFLLLARVLRVSAGQNEKNKVVRSFPCPNHQLHITPQRGSGVSGFPGLRALFFRSVVYCTTKCSFYDSDACPNQNIIRSESAPLWQGMSSNHLLDAPTLNAPQIHMCFIKN